MNLEEAMRNKILYIGEEIPESLMNDPRPKFILLGSPQQLIDEVVGMNKEKLTVKNVIEYYKLSWDFVVTRKLSSKIFFFSNLPRAFYRLFIKGV